ncbi:MAG: hypothetical protein Q4D25_00170 [Bacteroidales bacterium]|nr:hypothetical protein [Bacteroidales bacterium]
MKKTFLTLLAMIVFAIGFVASYSDDSSNNGNSSNTNEESPTGTYYVTDKANQKYVIRLKDDNTASIEYSGVTMYGEWDQWYNKEIHFFFSYDETPTLMYEGGNAKSTFDPVICDGWFYPSEVAKNAKNPNLRLSITKAQ